MLRKGNPQDAQTIGTLFAQAKIYLKQQGIDQWQGTYPAVEDYLIDCDLGIAYVAEKEGIIVGYMAIDPNLNPCYAQIEEGSWNHEEPYATIHRICVLDAYKGRGIAGAMLEEAGAWVPQCQFLRVDTHPDNRHMQQLIHTRGYRYCGIIYVEDGTKRFAYSKKNSWYMV